jgi:hypothetical protein
MNYPNKEDEDMWWELGLSCFGLLGLAVVVTLFAVFWTKRVHARRVLENFDRLVRAYERQECTDDEYELKEAVRKARECADEARQALDTYDFDTCLDKCVEGHNYLDGVGAV